MKGLLLEVNPNNYGIVLLADGQVIKHRFQKGEQFEVGQELMIETSGPSFNWHFKKSMALAMSLLLIIGSWSYAQPVKSIYIDTNPSIRLDLNVYNRIVDAEGLNDDGLKVLANVKGIKHLDMKDGLRLVIAKFENQGYFKPTHPNRLYVSLIQSTSPFLQNVTQDIEDVLKIEREDNNKLSYVIQEIKENRPDNESNTQVSPFREKVEGNSEFEVVEEIFSDSDFEEKFHHIESDPLTDIKDFEEFDDAFENEAQESEDDDQENETDD